MYIVYVRKYIELFHYRFFQNYYNDKRTLTRSTYTYVPTLTGTFTSHPRNKRKQLISGRVAFFLKTGRD